MFLWFKMVSYTHSSLDRSNSITRHILAIDVLTGKWSIDIKILLFDRVFLIVIFNTRVFLIRFWISSHWPTYFKLFQLYTHWQKKNVRIIVRNFFFFYNTEFSKTYDENNEEEERNSKGEFLVWKQQLKKKKNQLKKKKRFKCFDWYCNPKIFSTVYKSLVIISTHYQSQR